ncbi:MAG TPA: hypothetical protein VFI73_05955 [Candidatus Nitrosopolaris sp.]|nr:hypothetical protein [Candidatus Nitrosopolaris sp.]
MEISAGLGIANVILLIVLLTVYAKVYKSTRAAFTFGLMFFAGMLILHNIIAVYAYFAMQPLYAVGLLPYFAVIHIAELAGIAALLKVTL